MSIQIKAPNPYSQHPKSYKVFLGGSIEMGAAKPWQEQIVTEFKNIPNVVFLNPRREVWDSSWKQDPTPGTKFYEQVDWEMTAQDQSDYIVYYFDPDTKSAVTLLELGAYGGLKTVVCCPDGYWRKGNVQMFCEKYDISFVHTYDKLISHLDKLFLTTKGIFL